MEQTPPKTSAPRAKSPRRGAERFDAGSLDAPGLIWAALSSPTSFATLSTLLAFTLLAAAAIPQGSADEAVLASMPFSLARTVLGLELNDIFGSWVLALLALLLTLNGAGLVLRHALLPVRALGLRGLTGPLVARAEAILPATGHDAPLSRARAILVGRLGARAVAPPSPDNILIARKGLWREAALLAVLGLGAWTAGTVVDRQIGFDARVTHQAGAATAEVASLRAEVVESGRWIERGRPVPLNCAAADPADTARRRVCELAASQGSATPTARSTFTLGAGRTVSVDGLTISAVRERPLPASASPASRLLVAHDGAPATQLLATHGSGYRLGSGEEAVVFAGPDGPLVVVTSAGGPPTLFAPVFTSTPMPGPSGLILSGVPAFRVEARVVHAPGTPLRLAGIGVLLVALLLLLLPQLSVTARLTPEGAIRVAAISMNRRGLPATIVRDLARPPRPSGGPASGGPS